jgi:hypothetical protein
VPETRVSNRETVLNSVRYQPDLFHLSSHPIEWCPWTIARLGGSTHHSLDSIPLEYSLGEVLQQSICVLADSFAPISVPVVPYTLTLDAPLVVRLKNTNTSYA